MLSDFNQLALRATYAQPGALQIFRPTNLEGNAMDCDRSGDQTGSDLSEKNWDPLVLARESFSD